MVEKNIVLNKKTLKKKAKQQKQEKQEMWKMNIIQAQW